MGEIEVIEEGSGIAIKLAISELEVALKKAKDLMNWWWKECNLRVNPPEIVAAVEAVERDIVKKCEEVKISLKNVKTYKRNV